MVLRIKKGNIMKNTIVPFLLFFDGLAYILTCPSPNT